jgi:hypothetical protein
VAAGLQFVQAVNDVRKTSWRTVALWDEARDSFGALGPAGRKLHVMQRLQKCDVLNELWKLGDFIATACDEAMKKTDKAPPWVKEIHHEVFETGPFIKGQSLQFTSAQTKQWGMCDPRAWRVNDHQARQIQNTETHDSALREMFYLIVQHVAGLPAPGHKSYVVFARWHVVDTVRRSVGLHALYLDIFQTAADSPSNVQLNHLTTFERPEQEVLDRWNRPLRSAVAMMQSDLYGIKFGDVLAELLLHHQRPRLLPERIGVCLETARRTRSVRMDTDRQMRSAHT